MSFLQRLEIMQWSVGGYRGGDPGGGGGGGSDNPQTGLPVYEPPPLPQPPSPPSLPDNGYDEAAYGSQSGSDASTPLDQASYLHDSQGNIVTDSSGEPIRTPVSQENYEEQQERLAEQARQDRIRQEQELERLRQEQQDAYFNEAYGGVENLFDFDAEFENFGSDKTRTVLNALYADQEGNLTSDSATNFVTDSIKIAQAGLAGKDFLDPTTFTQAKAFLDRTDGNVNLDYVEELGGVVAKNPPGIATFTNNIGKAFASKGLGFLAGGLAGDAVFSLLGSDLSAVEPALYSDAVAGGLTQFGAQKLYSNANIYEGVDGQLYINDTITNPFTGESYNNYKTVEQKTQETIAFNETQQKNQSQSDYDYSQVGEIVSGSSGNNINWRDFRGNSFSMSPVDIINAAVAGVAIDPEVVDAARFAGRVAVGENPLTVGLSIYGDNITSVLPEGYQRPTEAAMRIGLGGENRVAVLGDIYNEDLNLDNPLGKAGVAGLATFDETGDRDSALLDFTRTYFEEGGKLPDLELPDALNPKGFDFPDLLPNIDFMKWGSILGDNLPDLPDFPNILDRLPSGAPIEDFLRSLKGKVPKVDIGKINLDGIDLDMSLKEMDELGLDLSWLPEVDINLSSLLEGSSQRQTRRPTRLSDVEFGSDKLDITDSDNQVDIAQALLDDLRNPFLS